MLANKALLGYKASDASGDYTNLPGLKQIPELGAEPNLVENTVLTDTLMQYEMGIGDPGTLEYVFKFENTASSAYRTLSGLTEGTTYDWQETLSDGTTFSFSGQASVRRGGGGVNEALEFTLSIALQSGITVGNPASA